METLQIEKPAYRADIDGLRGVAVLAVLSYHYWAGICPGGFIGVDIFFVISGYLLSQIILSESSEGRFSLSRFYERRVRRIFPALFFLLACSTIFACLLLLPQDLISYSRSMLAASLSSSNFYFWMTSNYFDAPAAGKPLLHTWSLAVEEQFYLVFPIFIMAVHRYFRKYLTFIVAGVAIISLGWSVVDVKLDAGAAFYLPFTRAWELLTGTLLALRVIPFPVSRISRECIAALGGAGIVVAALRLTQNTPFPGAYALLPCLGAAAIIFAGQHGTTWTGRLLSQSGIVFIGLISYSLYLWHWPLLVFSKIALLGPYDLPPAGTYLLLPVISFVIAAGSWKFIETPFRKGPRRPSKSAVFKFGAACIAVLSSAAFVIVSMHGLPGRFPSSAIAMADYLNYSASHPREQNAMFETGSCYLDRHEPVADFDEQHCLAPTPGKKQVLVFGDSHAADLQYGLKAAFPTVQFLQATASACPPTLEQVAESTAECKGFVEKVLVNFIPDRSIKTVLLNANWSAGQLENLADTIKLLRGEGVDVVLMGPVPKYDQALPRLLSKSLISGKVDYARAHLDPGSGLLDEQMKRLANENWHVPYVSLMSILCPGAKCVEYAAPGVPLEFDQTHLTLQGSEYLGREINSRFPALFN
jgi:peptidoglycan/LPS O-acetylase OafA/YrhL